MLLKVLVTLYVHVCVFLFNSGQNKKISLKAVILKVYLLYYQYPTESVARD